MYAEVAVNRPVRQTFHYHVPVELIETLQPGHLVEIEFGTARMNGIVLAFHDVSPIPQTKPILKLLDKTPVVTSLQLELAAWLAENTLAPIGACLWLMLPPGLTTESTTRYTLVNPDDPGNTEKQKQIISLLKRRGPLTKHQLQRALSRVNWQAAVKQLIERGTVQTASIFRPPAAHPKTIRTARLAIPATSIGHIATLLGRESRRANILEVLRVTPGHHIKVSEVIALTGVGDAPIKALHASGDIRLVPHQEWVDLTRSRGEVTGEIAAGRFNKVPRQKVVLLRLVEAGKPLEYDDFASELRPALKELEKEGLLHRWQETPYVELLLPPERVTDRIIELRSGQIYLDILNLLAETGDALSVSTIYEQTGANLTHLKRLAEDDLIILGETEVWRDPLEDIVVLPDLAPPLTTAQQGIWGRIRAHIDGLRWGESSSAMETPHVFLVHGVTGSGKTEIYLRAVQSVLAQGRQAIVLVPEIALTAQLVRRFTARFPKIVSVIHSGLTVGERYDTWRRIRNGEIQIVVGARSALFVPLPDVGLIILDEEHDDSYKQSPPIQAPYYHARDVAIEAMRLNRGTVILGSATPDVTTMYRAQQGEFVLLRLPDRVLAHREKIAQQTKLLNLPAARYLPTDVEEAVSIELPPVQVIDMRQELRAGNRSIFSRELQNALQAVLAEGQQAILFLNRRGTATFVMCRDCGYIARCSRCDTPLTYHAPREALVCHYCGHHEPNPQVCPDCGSRRIKYFGTGTEKINTVLQELLPQARIVRWDQDTARQRGAHDGILSHFLRREADILVGTQMIAKGLDIPLVTLVGIISGDTAIGLPDYRVGERTFQLLTQVAGRAGRGILGGRVILQTYHPEHYAIKAAATHDFYGFYEREIVYRRDLHYPPFTRLARVLFLHRHQAEAMREAETLAAVLRVRKSEGDFTATEIVGPTPCFFRRLENVFRWQILVRSTDPVRLFRDLELSQHAILDIEPIDLL